MAKLLIIISIILAIVLFPPAALAVISNNAIPGDSTYPIKRSLENIIFAMASVNPSSKAWFAAARSDRRFKEFTTLIAEGKKASDILTELVEQTQVAANQITKVSDKSEKNKLIAKLSQSIDKYDQGLSQFTLSQPKPTSTSSSAVLPTQPASTSQSTPLTNNPISTIQPTSSTPPPAVIADIFTSPPEDITPASPSSTQGDDSDKQKEIEDARKKLEEIKKGLEESSSQSENQKEELDQDQKDKGKKNENSKNGHGSDRSKEKGKSSKE